MIFAEISPLRGLFQAGMFGLVGTAIIVGALYHLPLHTPAASIGLMCLIGGTIDLLAIWIAVTSLRWLACIVALFFRGPR